MNTITHATQATNLADILERVLDKGLVIAGDIKISLADVDLLTIRIRLLVASVERAREMGINWWEHDPNLTVRTPKGVAETASTGSAACGPTNASLSTPEDFVQTAFAGEGSGSTSPTPVFQPRVAERRAYAYHARSRARR